MPSPLLHSAAGLMLTRFTGDRAPDRRTRVITLAAFVVAANAPDLDFVPGIFVGDVRRFHHGPAHSVLAAGLLALGFGLLAKWLGQQRPARFGLVAGIASTTHLVLDMLSSFSDERHGVALLWPLLTERLSIPLPIFVGIWLDPSASTSLERLLNRRNLVAVLWELTLLGLAWSITRVFDRGTRREQAPGRARVR